MLGLKRPLRSSLSLAHPRFGLNVGHQIYEACLAASVHLGGPDVKSLGVTSSTRQEGRTTVALAMTLVQSREFGRRVLLIEMDGFEHPSVAYRVGANDSPGLGELVSARASLPAVLQSVGDGITVITAGEANANGLRQLRRAMASGLMPDLSRDFDVVIADLPPLLDGPFTRLAASEFERLLVVVRASVTPVAQVLEATAGLDTEPAFLLNGTHSKLPFWVKRMGGFGPPP